MNKPHLISALFVVAQSFVIPVAFSSVALSLGAGTDDNPYRLADKFDLDSGRYLSTTFVYNGKFDNGVYVYLRANKLAFESQQSDADSNRQNVKLGFRHKFDNKDKFNITLSATNYDKTYVSRSTGQVGTSGGEEIPDRYDNRSFMLKTDYKFRLTAKHNITVLAELTNKDYEEQVSTSLSNLDYIQLGAGLRWRYKPEKTWYVETSFRYRDREYDDKRARDDAGKAIEDSELSYDYYRAAISSVWNINRQHRLSLKIQREDLHDNFSGYYDRETAKLALSWRYKPNKNSSLSTRLQYTDYRNSNKSVLEDDNELEDDNTSVDNHGTLLSINYRRLLWNLEHYKVEGYFKSKWYNYDAKRDIYRYQRSIFELGASVTF